MKNTQLQPVFKRATEIVMLRYVLDDSKQINQGYCFEWAEDVFDNLEGSKICGHNVKGKGHTYIEYEDKYYDADCYDGVFVWWELPFFKQFNIEDIVNYFKEKENK
jgi:hypothetical protein